MDIEAISGPKLSESIHSIIVRGEIEPVAGTEPLVVFSLNVRDRVTISREARRRFEDWLSKNMKRNQKEQQAR